MVASSFACPRTSTGSLPRLPSEKGPSLNGYIITRLGESVGRPVENGGAARASSISSQTLRRLLIANVVTVALASLAALAILLVAWLG